LLALSLQLGAFLGHSSQLSEDIRVVDGDIGQHLTIQFNAGLPEAVDELAV
jgi:hypothetical protein